MPANKEIEVLPSPSDLEILECQKLLGTGKSYDLIHILSCYEMSLWVMEENKEWSIEKYDAFTHAKFILLREKILYQIKTNGRFEIITPF